MKMKLKLLKPHSPSNSSCPMMNPSYTTNNDDDEADFYGDMENVSPNGLTKNSSLISSFDPDNSSKTMSTKGCTSQMMGSNSTKLWNMGSLMASLPVTPSLVGSKSPTILRQDLPRFSVDYYSPTRQDMKSSTVLSTVKKQRRTLSMSTLYESATESTFRRSQDSDDWKDNTQQNYMKSSPKSLHNSTGTYDNESSLIIDGDHEIYGHVLPPVPEQMSFLQRRGIAAATAISKGEQFEKATPVITEEEEEHPMNHRPKPYQAYLDEVQHHKRQAELDAVKKEKYTCLLRKLRRKEAAIDEWELKQRNKVEFRLDKYERKLDKKRAEAVLKTHKKLAMTKMESEKRKAKARRLILKKMSELPHQIPQKLNDGKLS